MMNYGTKLPLCILALFCLMIAPVPAAAAFPSSAKELTGREKERLKIVRSLTYRLKIQSTCNLKPTWNDGGSGADLDGYFFNPIADKSYFIVGGYGAQKVDTSGDQCVILVREPKDNPKNSPKLLAAPKDWILVWKDVGSGAHLDGAIWQAVSPSENYKCIGNIARVNYEKPNITSYRCVHKSLTKKFKASTVIWSDKGSGADKEVTIFRLPNTGSFVAAENRLSKLEWFDLRPNATNKPSVDLIEKKLAERINEIEAARKQIDGWAEATRKAEEEQKSKLAAAKAAAEREQQLFLMLSKVSNNYIEIVNVFLIAHPSTPLHLDIATGKADLKAALSTRKVSVAKSALVNLQKIMSKDKSFRKYTAEASKIMATARAAAREKEAKEERRKKELVLAAKARRAQDIRRAAEEKKAWTVAAQQASRQTLARTPTEALAALREKYRDAVAVVIGNRKYANRVPEVEFAHNDANAMRRYLLGLGYREGNIIFIKDATQSQIMAVFGSKDTHRGKLFSYIRPGESDLTVFYSGHGVPGLKDKRGYLLPVDADPSLVEINGFPIDLMYSNLDKLNAKTVRVYMDACFSGDSPNGMLVRAASGISVKPRMPKRRAGSNMISITAAQGDQFASWDEDEKHGLFTKHLLEALRGKADNKHYGNGDGRVSVGEIQNYLNREMTYQARRRYNRDQVASVQGDRNTTFDIPPRITKKVRKRAPVKQARRKPSRKIRTDPPQPGYPRFKKPSTGQPVYRVVGTQVTRNRELNNYLLKVMKGSLDPSLLEGFKSITLLVTKSDLEQKRNPDFAAKQIAKAIFGRIANLAGKISKTITIYHAETSIIMEKADGQKISEASKISRYIYQDVTRADHIKNLGGILKKVVQAAAARVTARLLGAPVDKATRYQVLGKKAVSTSEEPDYPN